MRKTIIYLVVAASIICQTIQIKAQSGGSFEVKQSVIGNTGSKSSGETFSIDSTIGEAIASGSSQNASFSIFSGFWTPDSFAPTAATVSISGRLLTKMGRGIVNAQVTLTTSSGETRTTKSVASGYYSFTEVTAGETCILTVTGKHFIFANPTQVLNIKEDTSEINFVGENLQK